MPTHLTITAAVVIPAAPEHVWRLAVDWSRQREWIWVTRTEGGHDVGDRVIARTGFWKVGFTDPMVITEWDPPRRCVLTHTGKQVRGHGIFEVRPHPGRGDGWSEFRWTERLTLPLPRPIGAIASAVIAPVARLGLRTSLRRFARLR